jgi:hypothetical protein
MGGVVCVLCFGVKDLSDLFPVFEGGLKGEGSKIGVLFGFAELLNFVVKFRGWRDVGKDGSKAGEFFFVFFS